jgi:hypothetical protein
MEGSQRQATNDREPDCFEAVLKAPSTFSKERQEYRKRERENYDLDRDVAAKSTSGAIEAFVLWLKASGATSSTRRLEDLPPEIRDAFARISSLVAVQTSLPADIVSRCLWERMLSHLRDGAN